ncbi:MAG: chorismate synthase, partial [Defluviitaleaceae bacterium]|nr:chorismate synthase [Defluviitaleaceae bacterium]
MSSVWGERIKLTLFGESRGEAIGIVIDGLPAGESIDIEQCQAELARRAPGQCELSSARKEPDEVRIISGLYNGVTTGTPLCAIIENIDVVNEAQIPTIARPGHADYTAHVKYNGFADMRGGGHFSGRLTAPLVFAGSVARQILARKGVTISAKAVRIGNAETEQTMKDEILAAKADGDSVGGIVEVTATGVPAGLGAPFFSSIESTLAGLFFSIPAVKGVEFGGGFALAQMRGTQANDQMRMDGENVSFLSNNSGGILGGITSGAPITARIA